MSSTLKKMHFANTIAGDLLQDIIGVMLIS
jgi:hypothetical protein